LALCILVNSESSEESSEIIVLVVQADFDHLVQTSFLGFESHSSLE
jgi:hypothetical protein